MHAPATFVWSAAAPQGAARQSIGGRQYLLPGLLTLLVMAGALILGVGRVEYLPTLAALVIAPLSFLLTDVWKIVRLHRLIANLLAVVVVVWTLRDFFQHDMPRQLFAIARMLVLLQLVLMFQEKSHRLEWQILVLSLLDIVVAAALNLGVHFGFLLALYLALALGVVLLIYWEEELQGPPELPAARVPPVPWHALLGPPSAAGRMSPAEIWRASPAWTTVVGRALAILLTTSIFASLFFISTPRLRSLTPHGAGQGGPFAGSAQEVRIREPVTSDRPVMRVALSTGPKRLPLVVQDDLYMHGVALVKYANDSQGSRWLRQQTPAFERQSPQRAPIRATDTVVDIHLEPNTDAQVYGIMPVRIISETPMEVHFKYRDGARLMRGPEGQDMAAMEYHYAFATSGVQGSRQLWATPHPNPMVSVPQILALDRELLECTEFDVDLFPNLKRIADEVVQAMEGHSAGDLPQALALQSHLKQSGLYRYSKTFHTLQNPKLDPIEDFVANHRRGHCELFASALVMMLRSQGIPSRLVIGYKGGDFNSLGNYRLFRENHAHAWVEVFLPAEAVPTSEWAGTPSPAGAWFRLDPTPAESASEALAQQNNMTARVTQALDYADVVWREYVVGMSAQRQADAGFDPFLFGAEFAPEIVVFNFTRLSETASLKSRAPETFLRDRFSQIWWFAGLAVLAVLVGVLWRIRYLRERQQSATHRRDPRPRAGWELYERLLALLAQRGVERKDTQTAQEVTADALQAWRPAAETASGLKSALGAVVAAYHRVRFGGAALDKAETEAIEQSLQQIASYQVTKPA